MTDLLVPLVYLINYALAGFWETPTGWQSMRFPWFPSLLGFSVLVQVALVMGATRWQCCPTRLR